MTHCVYVWYAEYNKLKIKRCWDFFSWRILIFVLRMLVRTFDFFLDTFNFQIFICRCTNWMLVSVQNDLRKSNLYEKKWDGMNLSHALGWVYFLLWALRMRIFWRGQAIPMIRMQSGSVAGWWLSTLSGITASLRKEANKVNQIVCGLCWF